MDKISFTSASTFPAKLFCHDELIESIKAGNIPPIHTQINFTNKCNLNCSFCSCANRDRTLEIEYSRLIETTDKLVKLGMKAITGTGGGEPLLYEKFAEYIQYLSDNKIDSSLTTNGIHFNKLKDLSFLEKLTWCRISLSDDRLFDENEIKNAVKANIDWSFSYVLSKPEGNYKNIISMIEFANKNNFTHIRIVDDIIDDGESRMENIKRNLIGMKIDCSKIIWQGRKEYSHGNKKCLISLLKPNITPSGDIVGCCGIQFSSIPPMLDWPRIYSMGKVENINEIYSKQKYFDGSICQKCYYSEYNNALNAMQNSKSLKHKNFV